MLVQEKDDASFETNSFETSLYSTSTLKEAEDELETQTLHTEALLERLHHKDKVSDETDDTKSTRPAFSDTGQWVRWMAGHPTELSDDDLDQLQHLVHQNSFQLLLQTLDIELKTIEGLMS